MCRLGNAPGSNMCRMMQAVFQLTVLALLPVASRCVSPHVKDTAEGISEGLVFRLLDTGG